MLLSQLKNSFFFYCLSTFVASFIISLRKIYGYNLTTLAISSSTHQETQLWSVIGFLSIHNVLLVAQTPSHTPPHLKNLVAMSKVLCITPVIVIMYKLLHHPFQSHLSDFILLFIHSHLNFQVLPPQQSIISKLQCNHLTLLFVSILIPIKHLLNLLNPFQVLLKLTITSK
jgi:hypothetical protein